MAFSTAESSHPDLADRVRSVPGEALRTLVLEPVHPQPGQMPVVLDRESSIGSDAACDVCLPVRGVSPRHAGIVRSGSHLIIRAIDRRTWLNGFPVTESILREGDVLAIGPMEFRMRRATGEDLLAAPLPQSIPSDPRRERIEAALSLSQRGPAAADAEQRELASARSQLESRMTEVEAAHTRLTEERNRLAADRVRFENERVQLGAMHADLAADREQLLAEWSDLETQSSQLACDRRRLTEESAAAANGGALQQIAEARSRMESERRQSEAYRLEIAALRHEVEYQRSKVAQQVPAHAAQSSPQADGSSTESAASAVETAKDQLTSDLRELETCRADLQAARQKFEAERADLQRRLQQMDQEKERLDADRTLVESARSEIAKTLGALELERLDLTASRSKLNSERLELAQEWADLEPERQQLAADRKELVTEVLRLKEDCARLESRRHDLKEVRAAPPAELAQPNSRRAPLELEEFDPAEFCASGESADETGAGSAPIPEEQLAAEQAELCDSVVAYMKQLLAQNREGGQHFVPVIPRRVPVAVSPKPAALEPRPVQIPEPIDVPLAEKAIPDADRIADEELPLPEAADENDDSTGFGSLRSVANRSARRALATHSSRLRRRKVAILLVLTTISLLLASGIFTFGAKEGMSRPYSIGAAAVGVIALIELLRLQFPPRRHGAPFHPGERK